VAGQSSWSIFRVRLESDPNIAVGRTPWGPFAAAMSHELAAMSPEPVEGRFDKLSAHTDLSRAIDAAVFHPNESVLVVGRDIHRHRFAREAVDRLRVE
jgi:beta-N-acetylhexosaminidase